MRKYWNETYVNHPTGMILIKSYSQIENIVG